MASVPESNKGAMTSEKELRPSKIQALALGGDYEPEDDPPPPPPKDFPPHVSENRHSGAESYFNPLGLSRANSIYSLSRVSFSSQLAQLTSLKLPDASSLSSSIQAIPTAPAAAKALSGAAAQIQQWIHKASEVLSGLDADDDVEWAAAAGREGLGDVDKAVTKFETLVGIYVTAIEELQARNDIHDVTTEELELVVMQMDKTISEWEKVRSLLKGVKEQVEIAMEWEELWNSVLGDIGMEMDNLSRLVFEMEEKRHKTLIADRDGEGTNGIDIIELETIVEEGPLNPPATATSRLGISPVFSSDTSPMESPSPNTAQDDSSLLALFARMQPLRASLDFLPMRLSTFHIRVESVFPTACEELETRREGLEKEWKKLEGDAEALRRELGEDRWVLVFRNAGRQAQKMCESVERSIRKLQETIDIGAQQASPVVLAKKIENYEAKKTHYGPAIERVLNIIDKGVNDRLTINGEILRLQEEMTSRWEKLQNEMKEMGKTLDDISANKDQQLRDSISSIISMDRSALGSMTDTPGSSPASSVVMTNGSKPPSTPYINGSSRRSSSNSTVSRPALSRSQMSMPASSLKPSHLPRSSIGSRSSSASTFANGTISFASKHRETASPSPACRMRRLSPSTPSNKPRWNGSANTNDLIVGHNFKPVSATSPPRAQRSSSRASSIPLRSPMASQSSSSPTIPHGYSMTLPKTRTGALSRPSLSFRDRVSSPSPFQGRSSLDVPRSTRPPLSKRSSMSILSNETKLQLASIGAKSGNGLNDMDKSPTPAPHPPRPSTSLESGRSHKRMSLLPQPKARAPSQGQEDILKARRMSRCSTPLTDYRPKWR
ncbi:MAG: hypothetical protein M1834_003698 [Cirrosporium novae-zelandiae]|nr:MAG: hypothetical protein M1834_003698 [Cirrosporium novae-zelandiae]